MHSIVGPDMLSGEGGEEQRLTRERFACVYAVVLIMDWSFGRVNGGAPCRDEGRGEAVGGLLGGIKVAAL